MAQISSEKYFQKKNPYTFTINKLIPKYFWFPGNTSIGCNGKFRDGDSDFLSKEQTRSREPEEERQRLTEELNSIGMDRKKKSGNRLERREKG